MEFINKLATYSKQYIVASCAMLFASNYCVAQTIVISPNTVISHSKTYNNVTLDMSKGSFVITNNATLTINNSIINGNISKENPYLVSVSKGGLNLNNNQMNVKAIDIAPHDMTQSLYHVIQVSYGNINMNGNHFQIDKSFTAGFLITDPMLPTSNFKITNNKFERFHGALYLISTTNALISGNVLMRNTYGNIVMIGSDSKIIGNTVYFSGNNRLGDSIDVINSNNILVSKNTILTPTCHGIYVFNSKDIVVDRNFINGGITYAMNILTYPETVASPYDSSKHLVTLGKEKKMVGGNITITNNFMSQNRYGIAANDINGLNVNNNIFIQRFEDNDTRRFWTNNQILLQRVTNLIWTDNQYKEAYTQEEGGSNNKSSQMVNFPVIGGVSL